VLSRIDDSYSIRKTYHPGGVELPVLRSVSLQVARGERGTHMYIVGYAQRIIRIEDGLIEGSKGGVP
jgi:alpha-D-ribose 1-methylphosphonate 5-triphosphate synthase subunit PhnL